MNLLMISFIAVSVLNCSTVTIRDKKIYADLAEDGAHANCTLTWCPEDLSKKEWDQRRMYSAEPFFCMDTTDMNQFLVEVERLCTVDHGSGRSNCDYETKQAVDSTVNALRYLKYKATAQRMNTAKHKSEK